MIAIVIESIDRSACGGENYLQETLSNLYRAGAWQSPHTHSVQLSLVAPGRYHRVPNSLKAIRRGVDTGAPWVLKLEDDLDFIADFVDSTAAWLDEHATPTARVYPLGSSWGETVTPVNTALYADPSESILEPGPSFQYARRVLARGDRAVHNPGFWGGQALLFHRDAAIDFSEWTLAHQSEPRTPNAAQDYFVEAWGKRTAAGEQRPFVSPVPSFVQHIGRRSALGVPFFEFPWPGREWTYKPRREASRQTEEATA